MDLRNGILFREQFRDNMRKRSFYFEEKVFVLIKIRKVNNIFLQIRGCRMRISNVFCVFPFFLDSRRMCFFEK